MINGAAGVQQLAVSDHFLHSSKTELRHQFANLLSNELKKVHDEFGLATETLSEHRILCRDTDRTRVEMADAHHDATAHD